jgi:uncharacterized protein (DUF433 family)
MASEAVTELGSLLVSRPGYRNGWPCLRGSGITVHNVGVRFSQGVTIEEMCEENPHLDPSLFYAAVAYYLANRDLIEQQLDEVSAWGQKLAAMNPRGTTGEVVFPAD